MKDAKSRTQMIALFTQPFGDQKGYYSAGRVASRLTHEMLEQSDFELSSCMRALGMSMRSIVGPCVRGDIITNSTLLMIHTMSWHKRCVM